jgi:hypothetical protein
VVSSLKGARFIPRPPTMFKAFWVQVAISSLVVSTYISVLRAMQWAAMILLRGLQRYGQYDPKHVFAVSSPVTASHMRSFTIHALPASNASSSGWKQYHVRDEDAARSKLGGADTGLYARNALHGAHAEAGAPPR